MELYEIKDYHSLLFSEPTPAKFALAANKHLKEKTDNFGFISCKENVLSKVNQRSIKDFLSFPCWVTSQQDSCYSFPLDTRALSRVTFQNSENLLWFDNNGWENFPCVILRSPPSDEEVKRNLLKEFSEATKIPLLDKELNEVFEVFSFYTTKTTDSVGSVFYKRNVNNTIHFDWRKNFEENKKFVAPYVYGPGWSRSLPHSSSFSRIKEQIFKQKSKICWLESYGVIPLFVKKQNEKFYVHSLVPVPMQHFNNEIASFVLTCGFSI